MFATTDFALRIEHAEAVVTRAVAEAAIASGGASRAFLRDIGSGVACYVRPSSPLNKVIGVGFDTELDLTLLAGIEDALRARGEAPRIELSTLARPDVTEQLSGRGYALLGFENVLARALRADVAPSDVDIRVERVTGRRLAGWRRTTLVAVAASDETGRPVDAPSAAVVAAAVDDCIEAGDFERYVAYLDGALAGAASMRVERGVALLTGSATLPPYRRRGVQAALIAARLADARARGAELAVVTTAPGSQSQANVMKQGFVLVYSRAILTHRVQGGSS